MGSATRLIGADGGIASTQGGGSDWSRGAPPAGTMFGSEGMYVARGRLVACLVAVHLFRP
eukprot:6751448-Prymnesium_polylepis.1